MNDLLLAPPPATPSAQNAPAIQAAPEPPVAEPAWPVRWFRFAASLQLAVTLLSLFAACLAVATFLESAHGARLAQELIYRAWWFAALLACLAVNVLCAALKKYPWKRHQTGFLITHAGLLVLLAGGLLTVLTGKEGQMLLIDTAEEAIHQRIGLSNHGHILGLPEQQTLQFFQLNLPDPKHPDLPALMQALERGGPVPPGLAHLVKREWSLPFQPGSLAWRQDIQTENLAPWYVSALQRLADPLPGVNASFPDGPTVTLENYYPHTESWPYRAAPPGKGFPVLKLALGSPMMPRGVERWVAANAQAPTDALPAHLEIMRLPHPDLLAEFLNPPAARDLGPDGQLVLLLDGRAHRIAIDASRVGQMQPLPGGKRQFKLVEYASDFLTPGNPKPGCPAVRFEIHGPEGKTEASAFARLPHLADARGPAAKRLACWYHFPDHRWGVDEVLGSLQFLQTGDGKLYYRVYGKDGLRQPGQEIAASDRVSEHALPWGPMQMRFRIAEYLPRAVEEPSFIPRALAPGSDAPRFRPVTRGKIHVGGRSADFWVRLTGAPAWVELGGQAYVVRYQAGKQTLDWSLTLESARRTTDPGTNRPASFVSEVTLATGAAEAPKKSRHTIAMNQPLSHAGFNVYQTTFEPLVDPLTHRAVQDEQGRPVHLSGFTVARDPGLWFKYFGSTLVVLGIATMFFMRAYFFRRPTSQGGVHVANHA